MAVRYVIADGVTLNGTFTSWRPVCPWGLLSLFGLLVADSFILGLLCQMAVLPGPCEMCAFREHFYCCPFQVCFLLVPRMGFCVCVFDFLTARRFPRYETGSLFWY